MILFYAGAGTSQKIRPEDVLKGQKNIGILLAFCEIHNHKSSESSKRFKIIRKKKFVPYIR